jgi:hypothetical protein
VALQTLETQEKTMKLPLKNREKLTTKEEAEILHSRLRLRSILAEIREELPIAALNTHKGREVDVRISDLNAKHKAVLYRILDRFGYFFEIVNNETGHLRVYVDSKEEILAGKYADKLVTKDGAKPRSWLILCAVGAILLGVGIALLLW